LKYHADFFELIGDAPGLSLSGVGIHREVRAPHFDPVVRCVRRNRGQEEDGSNRDRSKETYSGGHDIQDVNDCGAPVKTVSWCWNIVDVLPLPK
jgi:hypothetical protein